ncbi:MAG: hypothetical protein HRU17_18220 [Polyangiaceae bacterium]|nr:hypothetical protein [Polyangiaceae bacterium]
MSVIGLVLAAALVVPVTSATAAPAATVLAKSKSSKTKATKVVAASVKKSIKMKPRGLRFGMSAAKLATFYDKVFDKKFIPKYRKLSPGPRMAALDIELANKKKILRKNLLKFDTVPMGMDKGALRFEFTHGNGESMTKVKLRKGVTRYFFFFNDALWKVYEEHKLRKKGALGKTFDAAVEKVTKQLATAPKTVKADPDAGLGYDSANWADSKVLIRLLDREEEGRVGLLYIDKNVEKNLHRHRVHKSQADDHVGRDVRSVTRH